MLWTLKTDLTKKYAGSRESGNMVSNQDMRCLPITQGRSWGHSSAHEALPNGLPHPTKPISPPEPSLLASLQQQGSLCCSDPQRPPTSSNLGASALAAALAWNALSPHTHRAPPNPSSLCSDAISRVGYPFPPFPYWPLPSSPAVPTGHPRMPILHHIT